MVNRSDASLRSLPQALYMGLPDDEQRVLDAIEYQLLSEDPQLRDCFSALGSLTPPIKLMNGWWRTAPDRKQTRRGPRQLTFGRNDP